MYWSTEDHHRHHQPNYYNNFQIVQHQNGIQQATAAVPPQQHQQHPTPPPPLQQQQQQQQQQQHHHQQSSHRTTQQIPSHYAANQQLQHPQHQHHQWTPRPPLLTSSPFFQQFPTTVSNSTQYCAAPPPFFHQQRVTQASAVSAPSQQRPCLPPGCAMYSMPPQAPGLRQNVITQPPAAIMTPPTTSSAQQMQVQYFSASQYCQPPPLGQPTYGHAIAAVVPETPVVKPRKHAIPIIDPKTKENIFERDLRKSDSTSPADTLSLATTSSSTSRDIKESENDAEEELHIPQTEATTERELEDLEKHQVKGNTEQINEDITDSSVQSPAVVDHVDSIEVNEEEVKEETAVRAGDENNICDDDMDQTEFFNTTTTTIVNEHEAMSKYSEDDDNDKEISTVEGNLSPTMEATEKSLASPKPIPSAAAKFNKQQHTQKHQPPAPKLSSNYSKKSHKKNKRLKEIQKKQRVDLTNNENNNNTNKITNQNDNKVKQTMTEPCNSNRLTAKAKENSKSSSNTTETKEVTATPAECGGGDDIVEICATAATSLEEHERSDESSNKVDDSTATSNTNDDNNQSEPLYDSLKLTKSEQIASEILGIESTDDNEIMFLNSSVSGYEEDISSSSIPQETETNDKAKDILFGDFSQENPAQEISLQKADDESQEEKDVDDENTPLSTPEEQTKFSYTMEQLKLLASEPASKIPPRFRGKICEIIGKNPRGVEAATHMHPVYQQNQMFQQISFKESLNYLNRKRGKRMNDVPPYQQFQQHYEHEHDQQQQAQQQQQQLRNPDIIRVYLSLNEQIQLAESENAWVPAGLKNCRTKSGPEDDEQILKKIRGILNKLTPENFDKLLQSTANFPMNGVERMKKVMLLIFEKTVSEPNFAPTYARFCKFLFDAQNENHNTFKSILIKRVQDEFESNVNNAKAKNAKLRPLMDRLAATTDPKEQLELKAELDDQEYQFRRRAWGTVRFIGEMFKVSFLNIDRVCFCVESLLDPRCEEKLEYMCKLLTTVGAQLEPVEKQQANEEKAKISERLNATFATIRKVVEKKKRTGPKISSRVRFMMQDVLELRARSWDQKLITMLPPREVSPAFTRGPASSQRGMRNYGNNYLPSGGYEKKRQTGDGQKISPPQLDVKKLLGVFSSDEPTTNLGNSSGLIWKTVGLSQQQQQPEPLPMPLEQELLSSNECERLVNGLIAVAIEEESPKEWFAKWNEIEPAHHPSIIYHILTEYVHSVKVKRPEMDACTRLFTKLMKKNLLTRSSFNKGYQKFTLVVDEMLMDAPMGWQYVFNFLGPLLHHELLLFDLIWDENWFNTPGGDKFLESMVKHFTSEFGANYMRYFWENNSLRWDKFIAEERIATFIANNRFEFIENHKCVPPIFSKRSSDELVQRIKTLFGQCEQDINLIIDFISTNVHIDCNFIRNLTMFLCDYTVIYCNTPNSSSISSNSTKSKSKLSDSPPSTSSSSAATNTMSSSYKLQQDIFLKKCIPVLRRCIDSKDEHELSCLSAIVTRCRELCDSSAYDLICAMIMELYGEVISKESFEKWYQQQQQHAEGKDKLTNDLNAFYKKLTI